MHMEQNKLSNSVQDTLIILKRRSAERCNIRKHCVEPKPGTPLCDITFQNLTQKTNNE